MSFNTNFNQFDTFQYPPPGFPINNCPPSQNQQNFVTPSIPASNWTNPRTQIPHLTDEDFIKQWEDKIKCRQVTKVPKKPIQISQIKESFRMVLKKVADLKDIKKYLDENIDIEDNMWLMKMKEAELLKLEINNMMEAFNDDSLQMSRNILAKRSAKRLREKNVRLRSKKEKIEREHEWNERSRVIDENMHKIKDAIQQAKQEEDIRIQADTILRDVIRMKNEAKKNIGKLEALQKLRKARQNSAKGRGETLSENDTNTFNNNIGKLKIIWEKKLFKYEETEAEVRAKLRMDSETNTNSEESRTIENLKEWQLYLFGSKDAMPQRDFHGDINSFVDIRSQWDTFLDNDGTSLPIGWVIGKESFDAK